MSARVKPQPEAIEDFEVVYLEEDGTLGTLLASASLLAHSCSSLLLSRCKVVGVCRLGEGPE